MANQPVSPATSHVLVKLRATAALRAAAHTSKLVPLHESGGPVSALGLTGEAQWYVAELEAGRTAWDVAHARVASQLGVTEGDVIFAEPDLLHSIYPDPTTPAARLGVGAQCTPVPQEGTNGKVTGPADGWHLGDDYSQLASARAAVQFTEPRTRIAHCDTGYYRAHVTLPRHLRTDLQRNFVPRDGNPGSAEDPDNRLLLLDNSGHGTGTLSILAGNAVAELGMDLGGAPDADVVPLRIADSVVLLRTSAFARALRYAVENGCDVLSMSMGGLPSEAWRETVDDAYLAGLCMVTAAGNNFGGLPTRHVVYPARYGRVLTACGVMANGRPYTHLQHREMEGNYGPKKVMRHALGAYTPNIPWAVYGCPQLVRMNGAGTSAATPQIAAAVALWFEKYKNELPRDWRRVEAVRKALFSSAAAADPAEIGLGILRASAALAVRPDFTLKQTPSDGDSFAFLRVITGLGLAEASPRERMYNLELMQRWQLNAQLQQIVPEPDEAQLERKQLLTFMQAVIEDEHASITLRRHVADRYHVIAGQRAPNGNAPAAVVPRVLPACAPAPAVRPPAYRRLRAYAVDPSFATRLDTADINEVTLKVRWEELKKGPVGAYLAVRDVDPGRTKHTGVDLDDPRLLAQDGWAPSEGNPQFHQQMVYAVAMRTIEVFERALGRPVLWRHAENPKNPADDSCFEPQLEVRPHALQESNAYYSPDERALLFGYFDVGEQPEDGSMPGSRVYTCLSQDIVSHETTHAILDGMHRRFNEPTNADVLAFHEAFADIVALLQHFTIPELLQAEIARVRGDIEAETMLGSLGVQFGRSIGQRGALREAIGTYENGVWRRAVPDPGALRRSLDPHDRGAILVSAVFDAFIAIYKRRIDDLLRIATGGTGVIPAGHIHPDLVGRLSDEASKAASHVLNMCIRAIDYLPPVDVTFFGYLRALITADSDVVASDRFNYRVAFVEAFRRRGIFPMEVADAGADTIRTLSVDTLRWQGLDFSRLPAKTRNALGAQYAAIIERLQKYADSCLYLKDREALFNRAHQERRGLHRMLREMFATVPEFAQELGVRPDQRFEVHELRPAMRVSPDGRYVPQVVVALTQSARIEANPRAGIPAHTFRGGSTLIVDLSVPEVKYRIIKNIASESRRARTAAFVKQAAADPLRALFFAPERREPFAALHALAGELH